MANTYRFKTIMVSDWDRSQFTKMRDNLSKEAGLRVTDKELFGAIFDVVDRGTVVALLSLRAEQTLKDRDVAKLEKLQAKVAAKLEALNLVAEPNEIEALEAPEASEEAVA